jgi:alpha-1,6-mannosyltransferase
VTASSLCRKVNALGAFALLSYAAIAVLSYFQAPALWSPAYYPRSAAFFSQLYGPENISAIQELFDGPLAVILSRWIPELCITAAAIALIAILRNVERRRDNVVAKRILLWAFAFAAISFFAYPVYTQDFWLSALWGDMTASGVNPYHVVFAREDIGTLPLDHFSMAMSYGPLWAILSGLIMGLAGGSIVAAAVLFKAVLLAAWCGTLVLVDRLITELAPGNRSLALVIAGWVPLGVLQTVAEGHNDIFLALPVILWIALLLKQKASAPLALAVSVLCKYATAPLFLVDMLYVLKQQRASLTHYIVRLIIPGLVTIGSMALFYQSFAFFDGVRLVGSWEFMRPTDAFAVLVGVLGDWIAPLGQLILLIFPAIAAYQCWIYWKTPNNQTFVHLVIAMMSAVSFAIVTHVWPWYLVWTLPLAALAPRWWLSRFIVGMCLIAPFAVVVWWVPEFEEFKNLFALTMYGFSGLWVYATANRAEELTEPLPANVRLLVLKSADAGVRERKASLDFADEEDIPAKKAV